MKAFTHTSFFPSRLMALLAAWHKLPHLLAGAIFSLAAIPASPAFAQAAPQMLFLSTAENSSSPSGLPLIANALAVFQAQAAKNGLAFVNGSNWLSNTTGSLGIAPSVKQLAVIVTFNGVISAASMTALRTAMQSDPNLTLVIFSDGCCQVSTNLTPIVAAANTIRPASWTAPLALASAYTADYAAPLDTASLYASTFSAAGLNPLSGYYYTPIINVPFDYALYTQTALPASPPPIIGTKCSSKTPNDCVVGLFIPQTASNNGQGACLFLVADASEFDQTKSSTIPPSQYPVIAQTFINAALDPNGACMQPVSGVPDLWVSLSEPDGPAVGIPSAITLTVGNNALPGVTASTDGQVNVTLPGGLNLVPGSLPAACTPTAAGFTCNLPGLAPDESMDFEFQIVAPATVTDASILAEVSGVTGEVNTANNTATLEGIATPAGTPDLSVHLSAGTTDLNVGVPSTVTLTVTNSDESDVTASSDGQVEVILPADLQLSGAPPSGCAATASGFICQLSGLAPGESTQFEFQIIALEPILADTSVRAAITQVAHERNIANNTTILHDINTLGSPDLLVTLSDPGTLPVDTPTSITLTVRNSDHPGVSTATEEEVEVILPPGIELVPDSLPAGCTATASGFTCSVANLAPGQSVDFDFQVIAHGPVADETITADILWNDGTVSSEATQRDISTADALQTTGCQNQCASSVLPTLPDLALALLSLIVAGSAAIRLRRKA